MISRNGIPNEIDTTLLDCIAINLDASSLFYLSIFEIITTERATLF